MATPIKPGFINIENCHYDDPRRVPYWLFFKTTVYDFEMPVTLPPMMFIDEDTTWVQIPDRSGTTNFCSTPPIIRAIPGFEQDRFKLSGTFHDNIYKHHWIWYSVDAGKTWDCQWLTRNATDDLLERMLRHEPKPASPWLQWAYREGVKVGGDLVWGSGDRKKGGPPCNRVYSPV